VELAGRKESSMAISETTAMKVDDSSTSYRYCGRIFSVDQIKRIRRLIADSPHLNRVQLSRAVCDLFGWFRPDGQRKEITLATAPFPGLNSAILYATKNSCWPFSVSAPLPGRWPRATTGSAGPMINERKSSSSSSITPDFSFCRGYVQKTWPAGFSR
jgi:hypothetical protein